MALLVLDSWPLTAYFEQEPAAVRVREILEGSLRGEHELYLSVVNLGEVMHIRERRHGAFAAQAALSVIDQYLVRTVDVDREFALAAARIKTTQNLAYADCFAVALARRLRATILTGDPDFRRVEGMVSIEWLRPQ